MSAPAAVGKGKALLLCAAGGFLTTAFALFFFDDAAPYHVAQGKTALTGFLFLLAAAWAAGPFPRRPALVHSLAGGAAFVAFLALETFGGGTSAAAVPLLAAAAWLLAFAPSAALLRSAPPARMAAGFAAGMIAAPFLCYAAPAVLTAAALLAGGAAFAALAPYGGEKEERKEEGRGPSTAAVLVAGAAFGAAVVHLARAYAVFQAPHPLPRHVLAAVCGLFALVGLFFARREFPGGHHFLNLLRRLVRKPPVEGGLAAGDYFSFSFVLLSAALLASAASFEFLGILGNTLPNYLPRDMALSIAVILAVKAAFVWGPPALALPGLVAAGGRAGAARFAAGAAAGVLLSLFSWKLGIVPVVYYAAGAAAVAGLAGLKRTKALGTAPMLFRLVLCALFAALALTAYKPDRTLAQRTLLFIKSGIDIRYTVEGFSSVCTVAGVEDKDPDKARTELYVDALYLGGVSPENRFLKLGGILPVLYGAKPREALVLNYSTGTLAAALSKAGCSNLTLVDSDGMKFALAEYFGEANHGVPGAEGTSRVRANPYRFPLGRKGRYDVVAFEPRPVALAGGWEQYDRRVLEAVSDALKEGGVCILPLTGLSKEAFDEAFGAFRSVFGGTDVFCFRVGVVLAGFKGSAPRFSLEALERFMGSEKEFCAEANINTKYDVLAGYIGRFGPVEGGGLPLSRARAPYLEEWRLRSASARQGGTFEALLKMRAGVEKVVELIEGDYDADALARFHASGGEVIAGMAEFLSAADQDAPKRAAEHFRTAVEENQGDYEARWFLNYLVKVGSVTLEGPRPEKKELNKLLQTVLTSQDNDERGRALRKLVRYANDLDVRDVLVLINDSDPAIRRELAYLLGHFGDPLSKEAVLRLLDDPEVEVVKGAIRACVRQHNTDAVDKLLELMDDEKTAGAAVDALQKLGSSRAAAALGRKLGEMKERSGLLSVLEALRKLGTPAQAEEIGALLDSPDERVREAAVLTLRSIAERHEARELSKYFLKALSDPAFWVRVQAVEGLKETGDPRAYEPLLKLFAHPPKDEKDETLDTRVIEAAAKCGGEKALKFLLPLADDPNVNIACAAVRSIGLTGAPEAEETLMRFAEEGKDQIVRSAALAGLFNMGPETALRRLPDFAYSRDALVARTAVRLLASVRTPEAVELLRRFLASGDEELTANAAEFAWLARDKSLAGPLFELASKGDPELTAAACRSLAKMADEEILGRYCRELLGHPLPEVRLAAARELRRLPSGLDRSYAIGALVKALSADEPGENLSAYTRTLAMLAELPGAPVLNRNATEEEKARAISWWKDWYGKVSRKK